MRRTAPHPGIWPLYFEYERAAIHEHPTFIVLDCDPDRLVRDAQLSRADATDVESSAVECHDIRTGDGLVFGSAIIPENEFFHRHASAAPAAKSFPGLGEGL